MAELKVEDIKRMSDDEMDAEVLKLKKRTLANLRFQRATGQLEKRGARITRRGARSRASSPLPGKRAAQNKTK